MTSCEDISAAISAVNDRISELSAAISNLEFGDLDLSDIKNDIANLKQRTSQNTANITQVERTANFAEQKAVQAFTTASNTAGIAYAAAQQIRDARRVALEGKRIGLGAQRSAAKASAEAQKAVSGFTNLNKSLKATNQVVSFNRSKINQNKTAANAAKRIGEGAKRTADSVSQVARSNKSAIKGLGNQVKSFGGKLAGLAGRVFQIFNVISTLATIAWVAQIAQTAAKNTARSIRNENVISDLKSWLQKTSDTAIDNTSKIANAVRDLGSLENVVDRLEASLSRVWTYIDSQIAKLRGDFTSEISKAFDRISQLQKYVDSQIQQLKQELKSEISKAFDRISQLQKYVDSQISRVRDEFKSEDRKLSEKISNLQKHFQSELQKLSQQFQSELSKLSEKISEILKQVESQIEKIREEFRSEVRKLSEKIGILIRQLNSQFERLKQYLKSQIPTIAGAAAAITVPIVLGQIAGQIAQQIAKKIPKVSCRYNSAQVGQAVTNSQNANTMATATNTFVTGALWTRVDGFAKTTLERLGPLLGKNGISGWLQVFGKSALLSRALSALTFITVLHNAAMMSRSLVETLGDTLSIGLSVIGINDEEGNPIDINQIIGRRADAFMASILGEAVWTNTKETWQSANRMYQSAANIISTMRSITDSSLAVGVWTAEQVAKIGNGLKADGVVGFQTYNWMPETVNHQSIILQRLEGLDEAASSLNMVVSELYNVKTEAAELANQQQEFNKELGKFRKEKEELVEAWTRESQSPPISAPDLEPPD